MKRIRDFFYNCNDIIAVLIILLAAATVIYWRVNIILDYPATLAAETTATHSDTDNEVDIAEAEASGESGEKTASAEGSEGSEGDGSKGADEGSDDAEGAEAGGTDAKDAESDTSESESATGQGSDAEGTESKDAKKTDAESNDKGTDTNDTDGKDTKAQEGESTDAEKSDAESKDNQSKENLKNGGVWKDGKLTEDIYVCIESGSSEEAVEPLISAGLIDSYEEYVTICEKEGIPPESIQAMEFTFVQGSTLEEVIRLVTNH